MSELLYQPTNGEFAAEYVAILNTPSDSTKNDIFYQSEMRDLHRYGLLADSSQEFKPPIEFVEVANLWLRDKFQQLNQPRGVE